MNRAVRESESFHLTFAGAYYVEVPPVPIPNTVVKLFGAENTWRVTAWEDKSMPKYQATCFTQVAFLF